MAHSVVDPVSRIEGHLSIEMEVEGGAVSKAWVCGNLYRGLENALVGHTPYDAALISERICGICLVSHAHTSCFAAEDAYGIRIPEAARLVRNIAEGAQILHSTILWFYNLAGLDYINPLGALEASAADACDVCRRYGTSGADFESLLGRLRTFAAGGQLSIFTGNWFDCLDVDGAPAYKLSPAENLVATAHYFEGIENQAKASQICAIIGGKMPHVMTAIPGGTSFVPTTDQLDDIVFRVRELKSWIRATMIPDLYMLVERYPQIKGMGRGPGRFISFGVLDDASRELNRRYLPAGMVVLASDGRLAISDVDASLITEDTAHAFYENHAPLRPEDGVTAPLWPRDGKNLDDKYTWVKAPRYDGASYEAGGIARMMAAYARNVEPVVTRVDEALAKTGLPLGDFDCVAGRMIARVLETDYVCDVMEQNAEELAALIGAGKAEYHVEPARTTGAGLGLWEAPRGALLHTERVENDVVTHYQEIIPSTWNLSPADWRGCPGPLEEMLLGTPVADIDRPLDAVRVVHSVDPCTACACHVAEPGTGRTFRMVASPWGVR